VEKSPTPRVAAPNIRPFTCYEIIAMHQSEMHPWLQVQIDNNSVVPLLTAYVGLASPSLFNCNVMTLPTPTPDPSLPSVEFSSESPSFDVPRVPLFDGNQPPAAMGTFGLHNGAALTYEPGSTLDLFPKNLEQCIDTAAVAIPSPCDTLLPPNPQSLTPTFTPIPKLLHGCRA